MNDNSNTQGKHKIEEQARRWVLRFDSDIPPGTNEIDELRAWIREDPSRLHELKRAEAIWSKTSDLAYRLTLCLSAQEDQRKPGIQIYFEKHWSPNFYRAAFLIPLIALFGLVLHTLLPQGISNNGHHSTGVGQIVTLTLEDQSIIHIDSNSEIEVNYGSEHRTITLKKGRALFEVTKDAQRPFIVSTPTGFVRAVGTSFSVSLKVRAVEVTVTDGIVDIGRKHSHQSDVEEYRSNVVARVEAGKTAVFDQANESISTRSITDIEDSQAWKDGVLVFKGQPLETVIDEILRYTDTEILIQDPALRSLPIGGRFKTGEISTLMDTLELNFGIKASYLSPNRIRLEADQKLH